MEAGKGGQIVGDHANGGWGGRCGREPHNWSDLAGGGGKRGGGLGRAGKGGWASGGSSSGLEKREGRVWGTPGYA